MFKNILFALLTFFFTLHDYHISHTTLYYNSNLNSIEITIKVSIEDLEKSLEKKTEKIRIGTDQELKFADEIITNYFRNNFKLFLDEKDKNYELIGKEIDTNLEDIYLYFELKNCNHPNTLKSIEVINTIFLDLEESQTNIVLIDINKNKSNFTFSKNNVNQRILLN